MVLDIRKCFERRIQFPMQEVGDPLLEDMLDKDGSGAFIIPNHVLWDETFQLFFETQNVIGVFYLGKIMANVSESFSLILFDRTPSIDTKDIKVGQYDGSVQEKHYNKLMSHEGPLVLSDCFQEDFKEYLLLIEKWVNEGIKPQDSPLCSFNSISSDEIESGKYNAFYYSKSAVKARQIIKEELTVKLGEIADILIPQFTWEHEYVISLSFKNYPFKYTEQYESSKTNILLHKGDVLIPRKGLGKIYLLEKEPEGPLYASTFDAVIRCKKIIPEYLYLYLNSEVAKSIIMFLEGSFLKPLEENDIGSIPIIVPRLDDDLYRNDFIILTSKKRVYEGKPLRDDLSKYYQHIHNANYPIATATTIEDLLNIELAKKIKVKNRRLLQPFLAEDIKELNICYNGGAFKATLILAGSIMEAILIDWLSEIDQRDYFEHDYMVEKYGRRQRGDLIDYINAIKDINKPHWMIEADYAHAIRKKRNLVHAKLCLKEDVALNDETCKEVIAYLKQIIRSRGLS